MKTFKLIVITACLILIASCSPDKDAKAKESTTASNTVAMSDAAYPLGQIIHLPIEPESVKFQTVKMAPGASGTPSSGDWGIVALIKFSDENLKIFLEKSSAIESKNLPVTFAFPWLKSTIDVNFKIDAAGNYYEFNKPALNAEFFYRSPLVQGAVFQISSNEILVYLHTQ